MGAAPRGDTLKRTLCILVSVLVLVVQLSGNPADTIDTVDSADRAPVPDELLGVWENTDRFVEFTENSMRIVLKPYYRFVYESFPPLSCTALSPAAPVPAGSVHTLSIRYPRDKKSYPVTVARAGDALFMNFMVRMTIPSVAGGELPASLDGVWLPSGSIPALRLYPLDPADDFYLMLFDGDRYFRVRYWKTDARERDVDGRFTGKNGKEYRLPKFFRIDGTLYTCISATGTILRNYEEGSVLIDDGALRFDPDRVVFNGTEAAYRHPVPYTLDGDILAFGEPYLVRSEVSDLDTTITEHNARRRPPRKPIFDFMELDFHWDEVERLRGNIFNR